MKSIIEQVSRCHCVLIHPQLQNKKWQKVELRIWRFYPKLLFFFGKWFAAAAAGWPLLLLPNAFLCFFVRTVWNNTNQGWKLTPSIPPTVDTILTVASNYVYYIHYLSEWSFQPAGSPVQGVLLVWAVLAHSFLLCLVSFYKPTTSIVFYSLREFKHLHSSKLCSVMQCRTVRTQTAQQSEVFVFFL